MTEALPYIYNLEFGIDQIDIYDLPEIARKEELETLIQFKMHPNVLVEITEDELIDAVNCSEKRMKQFQFCLSDELLRMNRKGQIVAKKVKCAKNHVEIGTYDFTELDVHIWKLKFWYDAKQLENEKKAVKIPTQTTTYIRELVPLTNSSNKRCGSLIYILRLTCYGPRIIREFSVKSDLDGFMNDCCSLTPKTTKEEKCLNMCDKKGEYDEYMAQINGNSLAIRLKKNNPYVVTRVSDPCNACDQQIDFEFPHIIICCQCKNKLPSCKCIGDSNLTDFQKKTSCIGSSYKNAFTLPAIRGNLKYPGRFEDQSIGFNVRNSCCHSADRMQTRNACLQVDKDNVEREMNGKCKVPKGIKMYKHCDNESDIFVLKLGKCGKTRDGKDHEIEIEMRTPRGLNVGPKRMQTREIQVNEDEFEDVITKKNVEVVKQETLEKESVSKIVKNDAKVKAVTLPAKKGKKSAVAATVPVKRK